MPRGFFVQKTDKFIRCKILLLQTKGRKAVIKYFAHYLQSVLDTQVEHIKLFGKEGSSTQLKRRTPSNRKIKSCQSIAVRKTCTTSDTDSNASLSIYVWTKDGYPIASAPSSNRDELDWSIIDTAIY